jgi:hypothetical protein
MTLRLRDDYDAPGLRAEARKTEDAGQARRRLACPPSMRARRALRGVQIGIAQLGTTSLFASAVEIVVGVDAPLAGYGIRSKLHTCTGNEASSLSNVSG